MRLGWGAFCIVPTKDYKNNYVAITSFFVRKLIVSRYLHKFEKICQNINHLYLSALYKILFWHFV